MGGPRRITNKYGTLPRKLGYTITAEDVNSSFYCEPIRVEDMNRLPPDREQLEQVKTELLAWAGLHRGKAISEEAMPRFHEIIDRLGEI